MTKPNVFNYDNYRLFLKDAYEARKLEQANYSYRAFNLRAGITSPSFYKTVTDGKRDLTEKTIPKFCKGLGLNSRESQFFKALVLLNQSQTENDRQKYFTQIKHFKEYANIREIVPDLYDFFFHWHNVAIYELSHLKEFRENPKWISDKLGFSVTEHDIEKAILLLKTLGLLAQDKKTLKWRAVDKNLATTPEVTSLAVSQYQKNMIEMARANLLEGHHRHRDISAITVATDEQGFLEAKRLIQEFRKELNVKLSAAKNPDRVYQINFQIFPLTKIRN